MMNQLNLKHFWTHRMYKTDYRCVHMFWARYYYLWCAHNIWMGSPSDLKTFKKTVKPLNNSIKNFFPEQMYIPNK